VRSRKKESLARPRNQKIKKRRGGEERFTMARKKVFREGEGDLNWSFTCSLGIKPIGGRASDYLRELMEARKKEEWQGWKPTPGREGGGGGHPIEEKKIRSP